MRRTLAITGLCALLPCVALALLAARCSPYERTVFVENALKPTPYYKPANQVRPKEWAGDRLTVAWLGHATVLINLQGTTILTDPVLTDRLAPRLGAVNIGIRRITQLPIQLADLPPIDVVLLSHAHHDHWDMVSLERLGKAGTAVIPTDNDDIVPSGVFEKVVQLGWGQEAEVAGLSVRAFRVAHWGFRTGSPPRKRGYNGYVVAGKGRTIVFVGDTAPVPWDWKDAVGATSPDLCILPIGEYCYRTNHQTPEDAWDAFRRLEGRWLVATHWRTFILAPRWAVPTFEPMERLEKAAGVDAGRIVCKEPGETFQVP